jgi:adenosylcobinamide-GDP ribazoletransferase
VGLALGAALAVEERLLSLLFPPAVALLVVLATWKLLTGGIHLDGLADCLDGLAGLDPGRRLEIMRDARVGVFGVLGLVFALALALAALLALGGSLRSSALLLAPCCGRAAPLLLARAFPPATPGQGMGAAFMAGVRRGHLATALAVVGAAALLVAGAWGLLAAAVGLAVAWALARAVARRLGGLTGDALGLGVEAAELFTLLTFAAGVRLAFLR